MIALVESRSWTNSGSVGTSKLARSALPAQFRNGRESRLSCSTASCSPVTAARTLPSAPLNSRAGPGQLSCGGLSQRGRLLDLPEQPLAQLAGRVLPVPLQAGRERRVVAVGGRRLLLAELGLRAHVGPQGHVGLGMLVALGRPSVATFFDPLLLPFGKVEGGEGCDFSCPRRSSLRTDCRLSTTAIGIMALRRSGVDTPP